MSAIPHDASGKTQRSWLQAGIFILISWLILGTLLIREPRPDVLAPEPTHSELQETALWGQESSLPESTLLDSASRAPGATPLLPQFLQWEDDTRAASLGDVRGRILGGEFERVSEQRSAGLSGAAHWYLIRARAPETAAPASINRWLLLVGAAFIDDVRVWVERRDGTLARTQLGDHFLNAERPLRARMHVVPFDLVPGEEVLLWVRTQSSSLMGVTLALAHPDAFFAREARINAVLGMLLGILSLALVIYALLGVWLRDGIMLAYALLVCTQVLLFNGTTGMLMQLVREAPWWLSDLVNGVGVLGTLIAASLLWVYILDLHRNLPWLAELHMLLVVMLTALLPLTLTEHYRMVLEPAYQIAVWTSPVQLLMAWLIWQRMRDRLSLIYLLAFGTFTLGMGITVFTLAGSFPANVFTLNAYPLCAIIHILLMAVAIALRITRLREEKRLAEGRAQDHRRFVALLTHEFRNPLASIDRSANFLQATGSVAAEPVQARIANVRSQVRRLNSLVTGFLRAGELEDGGLQPRRTPTELQALCTALHSTLDPDVQGRVELRMPSETLTAQLDPALVTLALENLLDNALRYSPDDGRVELNLGTPHGGWVDITITDSGPGLPEAEMARLGMPYYRGSSSLGTQGSGLGYYFSRNIARAHGGRIVARAGNPTGLRVTLRLPLL